MVKGRRIIPFVIMWIVGIASLAVGIGTYSKNQTAISQEDCEQVRAMIKNVTVEIGHTGMIAEECKYTVTYEYKGETYEIVEWGAFLGKAGDVRSICIYDGKAYSS